MCSVYIEYPQVVIITLEPYTSRWEWSLGADLRVAGLVEEKYRHLSAV